MHLGRRKEQQEDPKKRGRSIEKGIYPEASTYSHTWENVYMAHIVQFNFHPVRERLTNHILSSGQMPAHLRRR